MAVLVVFRILLTAITFALFCWAFYKLVAFVRVQGFVFNVPQVCLALEVIASLCTFPPLNNPDLNRVKLIGRILYIAVDPLSCYFVFGYIVGSFIDTVSIPYGVATFVLISFYWYVLKSLFNS